jgi:hypothetical protein
MCAKVLRLRVEVIERAGGGLLRQWYWKGGCTMSRRRPLCNCICKSVAMGLVEGWDPGVKAHLAVEYV